MAARKPEPPIATVPLPSADLITYRFDQTDKKFEEMFARLDQFGGNFVTREDSEAKRQEYERRFQEINDRFAIYSWYWRAVFSAAALALFTAITAILIKK